MLVEETLPLIDLEAEFLIVLGGCCSSEVRCLWTGCTPGFSDQRAPGLVTLFGSCPS